ncbi:MAG: relaxase/mobilization nuclease domain-containing protein [Bacteroidetes bacterium]|nr:relaxase/mobilization nuclease domain-containing protein [Bacteroidota bacterium]
MSRRKNIGTLINYILKEEKESEKNSFKMKHNLSGHDKERWIKQFEFNETLRKTKRKDQVAIYHEVMSFSVHDKELINRKVLQDMAKQFVELRGRDNIYLFKQHTDQQHVHIHVAMSGTKFLTGMANRISKTDFEKFRKNMEVYQMMKYPELKRSIVYTKERTKEQDKKHTRQSNKCDIERVLKNIYFSSKSTKDFEEKLRQQGHEPYYRGGMLTGLKYEGDMKFRFSKLGYDKANLDRLDSMEQEANQKLVELDDLRNQANERGNESQRQDRFDEEVDTGIDEGDRNIDDDIER